jgi:cytoskeletal protein CcmA (bactofilin family)
MKQIRKGWNDSKMATLGVAFCALMSATAANAITFGGAIVPGCARNVSEKTYVCDDTATTHSDVVSLDIDWIVTMLGSGVMKANTIALATGSVVHGDVDAKTTVSIAANAGVTGNMTAGTTVHQWGYVDRNVWAGSTFRLYNGAYVGRNVTSVGTLTIDGYAHVCQNVTAGTTFSLAGYAYVHGDLISGTTLAIAAYAYVNGNVESGSTLSLAGYGYVNGDLHAGSTLTVGAYSCIDGDVTRGTTLTGAYTTNCPLLHPRTRCSPIIFMRENY